MAKGTIVSKSKVKREKGYLYFVDKQGNVRKVKMARRGRRKKK